MSEPTLGVVLRATPLRESDLLVVLYTESHGRVSAVARGARRSQRRFAGCLSLLVLSRFQLGRPPRGDLWSLESAELVESWNEVTGDVLAVAHASYYAEIVAGLLPADAPEPAVLELTLALWRALRDGPSPGVLRWLELALLDVTGHAPAIERCAACGSSELAGAMFDPGRGGVLCARCAATSHGAGLRPLGAAGRAYLAAAAAAADADEARALDVDPRFAAADRSAARDGLVAMIVGLIGHPLRSLEYLAKLGAASRRGTPPP